MATSKTEVTKTSASKSSSTKKATETKKEALATPAKKASTAKKVAAPRKSSASKKKTASPEERYRMTEVAAYYIAERNSFAGNPSDYWIEAEIQIKSLFGE